MAHMDLCPSEIEPPPPAAPPQPPLLVEGATMFAAAQLFLLQLCRLLPSPWYWPFPLCCPLAAAFAEDTFGLLSFELLLPECLLQPPWYALPPPGVTR